MNALYIILNEQHKLLKQQKALLINLFGYDRYKEKQIISVPLSGWRKDEMDQILEDIFNGNPQPNIIFATSIPYLIAKASKMNAHVYIYLRTKENIWEGTSTTTCELICI